MKIVKKDIPKSVCQVLFDAQPKILEEIIAKNGKTTKYQNMLTIIMLHRAGTCNLNHFFFVSLKLHRTVRDVPRLFIIENNIKVSGNHTPEHIRSAAPTDKY